MLKTANPNAAATDLAELTRKWFEALPLDDRWRVSAHSGVVGRIRTSAYVDEELHFHDAETGIKATGLSGQVIDARVGHHITVVRLAARNSGRERPVVLFDHENGNVQILKGNFAPLLRSRFEGMVLLAGLALAGLSVGIGLSLLKIFPGRHRRHPSTPFFMFAGMAVPLGIVFTGGRRQRLHANLERTCVQLAEHLRVRGTVVDGELAVTCPAADAPPPAA